MYKVGIRNRWLYWDLEISMSYFSVRSRIGHLTYENYCMCVIFHTTEYFTSTELPRSSFANINEVNTNEVNTNEVKTNKVNTNEVIMWERAYN